LLLAVGFTPVLCVCCDCRNTCSTFGLDKHSHGMPRGIGIFLWHHKTSYLRSNVSTRHSVLAVVVVPGVTRRTRPPVRRRRISIRRVLLFGGWNVFLTVAGLTGRRHLIADRRVIVDIWKPRRHPRLHHRRPRTSAHSRHGGDHHLRPPRSAVTRQEDRRWGTGRPVKSGRPGHIWTMSHQTSPIFWGGGRTRR